MRRGCGSPGTLVHKDSEWKPYIVMWCTVPLPLKISNLYLRACMWACRHAGVLRTHSNWALVAPTFSSSKTFPEVRAPYLSAANDTYFDSILRYSGFPRTKPELPNPGESGLLTVPASTVHQLLNVITRFHYGLISQVPAASTGILVDAAQSSPEDKHYSRWPWHVGPSPVS